jgi:hypothetical protein
VFNIKTLAMAAAVSAGAVLAMPAISQAMPTSSPVKIQGVQDNNIVTVNHRKHWKRWARYCRYSDNWRCHRGYRYSRFYRYRYYDDGPYYGYYHEPYYWRHRHYGPGVGLYFGID